MHDNLKLHHSFHPLCKCVCIYSIGALFNEVKEEFKKLYPFMYRRETFPERDNCYYCLYCVVKTDLQASLDGINGDCPY